VIDNEIEGLAVAEVMDDYLVSPFPIGEHDAELGFEAFDGLGDVGHGAWFFAPVSDEFVKEQICAKQKSFLRCSRNREPDRQS
jgi:hypothetical protein